MTHGEGNYSASCFLNHTALRTDLWWLSGDMKLSPKLPPQWQHCCNLTQLLIPFHMFPKGDFHRLYERSTQLKHANQTTIPYGSFDNQVYIDSIGVLQIVPDEFGGRNQVASRLESFLFWWAKYIRMLIRLTTFITTNSNVLIIEDMLSRWLRNSWVTFHLWPGRIKWL